MKLLCCSVKQTRRFVKTTKVAPLRGWIYRATVLGSGDPTWKHRGAEAPPGIHGSVEPVSLQASDERVEVALGKAAFGDLRNPCEDLVLRSAIAVGLDDEPPAAHVYFDWNAGVKSGTLKPAASQEQLGSAHWASVRSLDVAQRVAYGESPDRRAPGVFLGEIARNGILRRRGSRNRVRCNHG